MSVVRVLVVDDYETFRRLVCSFLEDEQGVQIVGEASDGLEAIQKVKDTQPDVILLDISLPKLNGIEAARQIRKITPECKIIFLSLERDPEVVRAAQEHTFEARQGLAQIRRNVCRARRYVNRADDIAPVDVEDATLN